MVIAENGSADQTLTIAKKLSETNRQVRFLQIPQPGKGLVIRQAWNSSNADILIFMDADLATDLKHLPQLLENLQDGDLVIGNRLAPTSQVSRSQRRTFYSKLYNLAARQILKSRLTDCQCGFKGLKKDAWQKIQPHLESESWFFDTELLALAEHFHLKIKELPINWQEKRTKGNKSRVRIIKTGRHLIKNLWLLKKRLARLPKEC